jgi:hypothetical protein
LTTSTISSTHGRDQLLKKSEASTWSEERIKSEADLALTLSHNVNRHEASRDASMIQEWIQELFQDYNQLDP